MRRMWGILLTGIIAASTLTGCSIETKVEDKNINVTNEQDSMAISFEEVELEKMIREIIDKPTGEIQKSEVKDITYICIRNSGIKDISPLV